MAEQLLSISSEKVLTEDDLNKLHAQNTRMVTEFKAHQLEKDALKNWDLFYKRNETRFFRDRHWTTREFQELLNNNNVDNQRTLLELGCGVGNFVFPLLQEHLNFHILACDFSPRAIELVKQHDLYDEGQIKAFQCDITTDHVFSEVKEKSVDIVTMIFVLSAIHPDKFEKVLHNVNRILHDGGIVLFRDYGIYDMAQLRFKAGHKIGDNFYMRQDGTRSYYFSTQKMEQLANFTGFTVLSNCYIHRRTVNKKENVDVPRIYVQTKLQKEK